MTDPSTQIPSVNTRNTPRVRELRCPQCDRVARLTVRFAGKRVRCPACATEFRVAEDMSRLILQTRPRSGAAVDTNETHPPAPIAQKHHTNLQPNPDSPLAPDAVRQQPPWLWWAIIGGTLALAAGIGVAVLWVTHGKEADGGSGDPITLTADVDTPQPTKQRKPNGNAANPPRQQPRTVAQFVQLNAFDAKLLKGLHAEKPAVALKEMTTLKVDQAKLIDVLKQLAERHKLAMIVDEKALTDDGIPLQMPVSLEVANAPLEQALESLLSPLLLTHVLPDENAKAIVITSLVKASGSSANTLLAGGFNNLNLPPVQPASKPTKRPPATPKRKPKPKPKPKPKRNQTPQSLYRKGRRLLAQRKIDEAIRELSKAIGKRRNYSDALYQRGYAYLLKQDNGKALTDLSRVIALNRNHIAAYSSRATIYRRMGFEQRAKADRIQALRLKKRTVKFRRKKRKKK